MKYADVLYKELGVTELYFSLCSPLMNNLFMSQGGN